MGAAPSVEFSLKWSRFCLRTFLQEGRDVVKQHSEKNASTLFSSVSTQLTHSWLSFQRRQHCPAWMLSWFPHLKIIYFLPLFPELVCHFNPPQLHLPSKRLDQSLGFSVPYILQLFCGKMRSVGCWLQEESRSCRLQSWAPWHPCRQVGRCHPMPDVPNEAAGEKNLQNSVNSYKQRRNKILKSRNSS